MANITALNQANQFPAATTVVDPVVYAAINGLIANSNANGAGAVTGSGASVLQVTPTLTTPILGAATASSVNYIAAETGVNNAIIGTLVNAPALAAGLVVTVKLGHTLQAGANTFAYAGGAAKNIKSHYNVANDIGTAYAATGVVTMIYDGTEWLDMAQ